MFRSILTKNPEFVICDQQPLTQTINNLDKRIKIIRMKNMNSAPYPNSGQVHIPASVFTQTESSLLYTCYFIFREIKVNAVHE